MTPDGAAVWFQLTNQLICVVLRFETPASVTTNMAENCPHVSSKDTSSSFTRVEIVKTQTSNIAVVLQKVLVILEMQHETLTGSET